MNNPFTYIETLNKQSTWVFIFRLLSIKDRNITIEHQKGSNNSQWAELIEPNLYV